MLLMTFLLSGMTTVMSGDGGEDGFSVPGEVLTPMNPLVLNSSICVRVLESRCSVIPYPSFRARSLHLSTGA